MTGYPLDDLFQEVAYVSYYFHWPYDQIMALEHNERRRWVTEVANINQQINRASAEGTLKP